MLLKPFFDMERISYAITVCTEAEEFRRLLNCLVGQIRPEDEIVVLQDITKASEEVDKVFVDFTDYINIRVKANFRGDFAAWKNMLNSYCTGDYIFQLDADELPTPELLKYLPWILQNNSSVDLFWVPRDNRVEGITSEDIRAWNWGVDVEGRINWPDLQGRIYRRKPEIRWEGKVHEKIVGHKTYTQLPANLYLKHNKTIEKQRSQNALYKTLQ